MKIDLQDVLLILGTISLIAGATWVYRPAGPLLFGAICFAAVFLIERAKKADGSPK